MNDNKFLLNTPELKKESQLLNLVENQTLFNLNNCEFSIYETHKSAYGVKLHFDNIAFTAMLRGKKHMKLENKTNYFDYHPEKVFWSLPEKPWSSIFPMQTKLPLNVFL